MEELQRIEFIENRLFQIERQNRWLRTFSAICAGILALVILTGAQVINEHVHVREKLTVFDLVKTKRIALGVDPAGLSSGVEVYDKNGVRRVYLGVLENGATALVLYDELGREIP